MFNVHLFDQKLDARRLVEKRTLQQLLTRHKNVVQRETLTANYARRVDRFIMNMANDPIQVHDCPAPLAVVQRESHPARFQGPARMISGVSRSLETRNRTEIRDEYREAKGSYDFRPRDAAKELKPRRKKVKKEVRSRPQVISEQITVIQTPHNFSPGVSCDSPMSTMRFFVPEVQVVTQPELEVLSKKTHFKGVMSRLVESKQNSALVKENEEAEAFGPTLHRSRTASILWRHAKVLKREFLKESEGTTLAKEILETCKVIPKLHSTSFLKKGDGQQRRVTRIGLGSYV